MGSFVKKYQNVFNAKFLHSKCVLGISVAQMYCVKNEYCNSEIMAMHLLYSYVCIEPSAACLDDKSLRVKRGIFDVCQHIRPFGGVYMSKGVG